ISSVIDVEKGSLRAFEQNRLPALERVVQINYRIGDQGAQLRAGREIIFVYLVIVDRLGAKRAQDRVVLAILRLQFFREQSRLHQIGNTQPRPRGLVSVSRPDAALSGSNFRPA